MQVDEQQVLDASRELLATHLGLNILSEQIDEARANEERTLTSRINVSGPFKGAIVVECSESILRHAGAMLFAAEEGDSSEEDLQYALKELSAMVGKKMRVLLPETAKLSRPAILEDAKSVPAELEPRGEFRLNCEGRPVCITFLQEQTEPEPVTAV